ncbi:MAG: glycoside hydrolase family 11 protein, partial [Porcipelethomonas sp.]
KKKSNFLCVLLSLLMCVIMIPPTVAGAITVTTKSGQQINQDGDQIKGTEDGYSYELWNQNNAGTATMTLGEGGAYSCVWSNIENVLFRRGVDFDCTKTYKELGNISIEYEAEYNNPDQNTYLCVYGWTKSPLIEYYIVDSWGSWRPPGAESKGQISVDGGTYDVYVTDRINQPSIEGNTTFKQYWSVRTSKRTSGTISVSTHFAEWEKMGMETGVLYEAALNVEGYQSSGTANVTKNVVTVGGEIQEPDPVEPIEPDENGYYFHSTFESGTDDWDSRGGTTVETVSQNAYKGSKCLSVTGRTDSWNGTARSLPVAAFVPGQSYSFSTMVMQNSVASEDFRLTLQYDLAGETNYSMIASASGAKGEWVQLANTSYTIPEGASNLLLYVETADSTESFFVDEAIGAVDGTVIKEETAAKKGDVNGDGKVDATDISALTDFLLAKTETIEGDADINGDGVLNVFDLAMLRRTVLSPSSDEPDNSEDGVDISWIDPSKPMVAISFDDGAVGTAENSSSMRILNALGNSGFHSTFFYVGNWTDGSDKEAEVKKAYSMGMEIANHTVSHPDLTQKSDSEIRNEYDGCAQTLKNIIGTDPSPLLRLPYLAVNDNVKSVLSDVPMITCSIDTQDWNGATKDQMVSKIKTAMSDGSLDGAIVLAHETYDTTAEAMEELCPYLKSQGWQVVSISEMFAVKGKTLQGGQVYTKS